MRIEKAVAIRRPVEEVWSLIADLRNDPRWCDKVESVEQVAGDGPGEDARYRVLHRPVPLRAAKPLAVRQIDEIEWKLPPPARPVGRLLVSRHLDQQLAALKELVEQPQAGENY